MEKGEIVTVYFDREQTHKEGRARLLRRLSSVHLLDTWQFWRVEFVESFARDQSIIGRVCGRWIDSGTNPAERARERGAL